MTAEFVDPAPAQVWEDHARRHELAFQIGPDGAPVHRPRVIAGATWGVSAGRGTVYATTTARPRDGEPHDVSLIDLDEGFRMMSRVVGVAPGEVHIGLRVLLDWEDRPDDVPVPVFRPADVG